LLSRNSSASLEIVFGLKPARGIRREGSSRNDLALLNVNFRPMLTWQLAREIGALA
jgi:hypothetical protein